LIVHDPKYRFQGKWAHALILLLVLSGCSSSGQPDTGLVVARVGNEFLTYEEIRRNVPENVFRADSLKAITQYRDTWIESMVIYQEGSRNGMAELPYTKERLRKAQASVIQEVMREMLLKQNPVSVTESEVRDYYNQHRSNFVLQERYLKVRHVVTATLEDSRQAKNDLLRGVSWDMVVERYALYKDEALVNSERYIPESALFPDNSPMREYLSVMGISEISPIRSLNDQFHFIQITSERSAGEHPDLDWVTDHIHSWLEVEKRRRAIRIFEQNLIMQAQANNEIEFFNPGETGQP